MDEIVKYYTKICDVITWKIKDNIFECYRIKEKTKEDDRFEHTLVNFKPLTILVFSASTKNTSVDGRY